MVWTPAWRAEVPSIQMSGKMGEADELWGAPNKTLLAYANAAYQHIHMPGYVHPADGSVVTVTTDNAAGTFGAWVDVVGESVIEAPFDTHWVTVTNISHTGVYVVEFQILDPAAGTPTKYLTRFSVARVDNFSRSTQVYVQMPAIEANSRVGARVLNNQTGTHTVSFNIHYHEYE